jgi:hypothetical protein
VGLPARRAGREATSGRGPRLFARIGFGWYSGLHSNTSITWLDGQTLAFDEGVYSPPARPQLDPAFSGGSADSKSSAYDPRIFEYTVATGKSRLVCRRAGVFNYGVADVLWLNADGSSLIGAVYDETKVPVGGVGWVNAARSAREL